MRAIQLWRPGGASGQHPHLCRLPTAGQISPSHLTLGLKGREMALGCNSNEPFLTPFSRGSRRNSMRHVHNSSIRAVVCCDQKHDNRDDQHESKRREKRIGSPLQSHVDWRGFPGRGRRRAAITLILLHAVSRNGWSLDDLKCLSAWNRGMHDSRGSTCFQTRRAKELLREEGH